MLNKNEQMRDYTVSPNSDIWAIGVTLFKILFNKMPFTGENKNEVIEAILKA